MRAVGRVLQEIFALNMGGGAERGGARKGQEKCLRSRNNGLFSAVQPGLTDRPVGWGPALPCPDHL